VFVPCLTTIDCLNLQQKTFIREVHLFGLLFLFKMPEYETTKSFLEIRKVKTPEVILEKLKEKLSIIFNEKKYFKGYAYPLIRVNGVLKPEHRVLFELFFGKIPEGFVIHHKNRIKEDNRLLNLELMRLDEHAKLHRSNF